MENQLPRPNPNESSSQTITMIYRWPYRPHGLVRLPCRQEPHGSARPPTTLGTFGVPSCRWKYLWLGRDKTKTCANYQTINTCTTYCLCSDGRPPPAFVWSWIPYSVAGISQNIRKNYFIFFQLHVFTQRNKQGALLHIHCMSLHTKHGPKQNKTDCNHRPKQNKLTGFVLRLKQ